MTVYQPRWLNLAGVVNMRDLAGLPSRSGQAIREGSVLRSDNLQDLTDSSVDTLLADYGVTDVIDLRTNRERAGSGPSPLARHTTLHALSLYVEDDPTAELPPWHEAMTSVDHSIAEDHIHQLAEHYVFYLRTRPDNLMQALRVISQAQGAVVVHCAAGKDRTGTMSAVLLGALDVPRQIIVSDYAASNERVLAILERLGEAATAGSSGHSLAVAAQTTPPEIMERMLDDVDLNFGNVSGWLSAVGWTTTDQKRLEARLLD